MRFSRTAGVAFAILLVTLTPGVTVARTMGISAGVSVVFSYQILTTYKTPNGNYTATIDNQFTVDILEVNASRGEVWYTESINVFNSTTQTTGTPVSNTTTIFDPYDNESYLGNIGFYPFTYTDLLPGTGHLNITVPFRGVPGTNGTVKTGIQRINASVARPSGSIDVNYTIWDVPTTPPILTVMKFNATTGLLETGVTKANVFGVEKIFTYHLIGYSPPPRRFDYSLLLYALLAGIIVFAAYSLATRGTRRERKVTRMRKRLERPG